MSQKKIKVVIADDHPLIRAGIRHLLEKSSEIQVVGEACDGQQALDLVGELSPDILLLDLEMPVLDGFQVLDILSQEKAKILILIVTALNDPIYLQQAVERGAWGYFCKEEAPKHLVNALLSARGALALI